MRIARIASRTGRHHVVGGTDGWLEVDQVALDEKMTQAEHGDGFTPLGPWVETDLDPSSLPITVRVNGRHRAGASTADLAWNITEQLVYLTSHLSIGPGDVVLTGAPGTFTAIKPGDRGEIEIDGIGALSNPVRASNPVGAR